MCYIRCVCTALFISHYKYYLLPPSISFPSLPSTSPSYHWAFTRPLITKTTQHIISLPLSPDSSNGGETFNPSANRQGISWRFDVACDKWSGCADHSRQLLRYTAGYSHHEWEILHCDRIHDKHPQPSPFRWLSRSLKMVSDENYPLHTELCWGLRRQLHQLGALAPHSYSSNGDGGPTLKVIIVRTKDDGVQSPAQTQQKRLLVRETEWNAALDFICGRLLAWQGRAGHGSMLERSNMLSLDCWLGWIRSNMYYISVQNPESRHSSREFHTFSEDHSCYANVLREIT